MEKDKMRKQMEFILMSGSTAGYTWHLGWSSRHTMRHAYCSVYVVPILKSGSVSSRATLAGFKSSSTARAMQSTFFT